MINRADLHIHTTFSDGTLAPEDVLNYYAIHPEIAVIAITDHDTLDGALRVRDHRERHREVFSGVDVIVGEEISSRDGHIVGLFLERRVPPGLSAADTVASIHEQGGLAVAVHPYTHLMRFAGLKGVGDLILDVPFDAVETRNANITELYANWWTAWRVRGAGLCAVGSSDGHFDEAIGLCYTLFDGASAGDLRAAIAARRTRAGGRVYGPLTLGRYLWRRWQAGRPLLPRRSEHIFEERGAALRITVGEHASLDAVVLRCHGHLDFASSPSLTRKLTLIAESGIDQVLNLEGVSRLDSGGITCLVGGLKAARRNGRQFAIAGMSRDVLRAVAVARLGQVFPTFASEAAALSSFPMARAA